MSEGGARAAGERQMREAQPLREREKQTRKSDIREKGERGCLSTYPGERKKMRPERKRF